MARRTRVQKFGRYKIFWKDIAKYCDYAVPDDMERFYYAMLKVIMIQVVRDGFVRLPKLGVFYLGKQLGHKAWNPYYKTPEITPNRILLRFKKHNDIKKYITKLFLDGKLDHLRIFERKSLLNYNRLLSTEKCFRKGVEDDVPGNRLLSNYNPTIKSKIRYLEKKLADLKEKEKSLATIKEPKE